MTRRRWQSFDENAYVEDAHFYGAGVRRAGGRVGAVRRATLSLLRGLNADEAPRRGRRDQRVPVSVRALAWIIAGHVIHHTKILRERYLAPPDRRTIRSPASKPARARHSPHIPPMTQSSATETHEYFMGIALAVRRARRLHRQPRGRGGRARTGASSPPATTARPRTCRTAPRAAATAARTASSTPSGTGYDLCICVHAEQNALLAAARFGIAVEGSTMYTTMRPCFGCTKELLQAGVRRCTTCTTGCTPTPRTRPSTSACRAASPAAPPAGDGGPDADGRSDAADVAGGRDEIGHG